MPVRATKRGAARTPLTGDFDVLICGASFAGLAIARELRSTGARVLVLDRYEIGERQTSACAAPTEWLRNLELDGSIRQTFGDLLCHTPAATVRWALPFTWSVFDYPELCALLWAQHGAGTEFETAKVHGKTASPAATPSAVGAGSPARDALACGAVTVHTDRGDVSAPLIVDALGWKRMLAAEVVQPPDGWFSRGLEVHPGGTGRDLELWIDKRVVQTGYGWAFPAGDEVRIGIGSFDPHDHVKVPTNRLAEHAGFSPDGYQGNWIPHRIRDGIEDGVFFVGDSAGHCIPLTAEGIRTAWYFGIACGRELRAVLEGRSTKERALTRYGAFTRAHAWKFEAMLGVQTAIPKLRPRPLGKLARVFRSPAAAHWAFQHYLNIAHPSFALPSPPEAARRSASLALAA
jgi:flavin-dependent dehydrogenase